MARKELTTLVLMACGAGLACCARNLRNEASRLVRDYYDQTTTWFTKHPPRWYVEAQQVDPELRGAWIREYDTKKFIEEHSHHMRMFMAANPEPKDPWGTPIMWINANAPNFAVVCAGPDGEMWTRDDIRYPPKPDDG